MNPLLRTFKFISTPPSTPKGVEKLPRQERFGVHYDTKWANGPWSRLVRRASVWGFFKPAVAYYADPKVIGTDRLERLEAPLIFAANHHSHADTSVLLATLPAHLRQDLAPAAGADYFFTNRFTSTISALFIGAIPIERMKVSKLSVANSLRALEEGRNLLIFPEGGRSPDGWSRKHRPGAAFLAKQSGVPVVPVYLDGTGSVLPKGSTWPRRSRTAVVFGEPMELGQDEDVRDFAERVEKRVAQLADEFSSGWWESRRMAYRNETSGLTGPDAGAWRRRWALGPTKGRRRQKRTWPKL